jgi:DNA helicase-2/ATP-dependent DNA helicase PcrA
MDAAAFEERAESFREQKIARVFHEYQKRLADANALDFDDLIGKPIRLFDEHPEIRDLFARRFRYVLVDEYQDTNAAQVRLIQHLASTHENLCVVGDDDQSIYGWRGADVGNILTFEQLYPRAKTVRLEQNYRSTGKILAAANAVVKNNRSRKEKTLWTDREDGDLLALTILADEEAEAAAVVAAVTREVNHHGVPPSEAAVLYRTNAQSRALETGFRNASIPYELVGGVAFYQRREVKDLLAYLRLVVNDQDDLAFTRIVNVPKRGIGGTTLTRLAEHAEREGKSLYASLAHLDHAMEIPNAGRQRLLQFRGLIEEFRARAAEPVDVLLKDLVDRIRFLEYLDGDDPESAFDRAENVGELVTGAHVFAERNREEGEADAVAFLGEVALLTDVDRYDEKAEKVRLMTIHNAKGLEFRVVCLPGLEEGLLPHVSSMDAEEDLEEERRLFYVALTRAKDRAHLFAATTRQKWGGTNAAFLSRFANEIPGELVVVTERGGWNARGPSRPRHSRPAPVRESGPRRSLGTIIHPTFGRGDVVEQEGTGIDARLTVVFEGNIRKKIVARFAEWEDSFVDL